MIRLHLVLLLAVSAVTASAQTPPALTLTLEQALAMAEQRSETIAIARTGIDRADADIARARSGRRPQLSASVSFDRSLASEFEGVFDNFGGGAPGGPGAPAEGEEIDLPFGRENTWRLALSLSQSLYSGGRFAAQDAVAAAGQQSAAQAVTTARAQLLFDVTQAYYDAALSDRMVAIAEATLGQAEATLRQVEASFQAGVQPEFELLRARVTRDTQNPAIIRQRVNREIALLRLKQLLDLPANAEVRLAESLMDSTLPPPAPFATRVAAAESLALRDVPAAGQASVRTAIEEAMTAVTLQEASLALTQAQGRPSVSLTSNYGRVTYPSGPVWGFSALRTNWTIGASLQIPLLTGGRQQADERTTEANVEAARIRLRQVEKMAELDRQTALAELLAARATWDATAGTVQQAGRAYEIADVRYRAGVSTQLELADSRLLLQQSEANRAQAARDLQVARARIALLPNLPIGTGAPGGAPRMPPATPAPQQAPAAGGGARVAAAPQGGQGFGGGQ